MRSNQLMSLKAELNSLNLTAPADIQKYESIIESVAALPSSEGKRNLNGINTSKDVAAEIEKRALDAALSKERVNQARLMTDAAHKAIDSTLIRETEDIIESLRPIAMKAHKTIMDAHTKMNGSLTADAAIEHDASKDYKAALEAWDTINTAASIRATLYTLESPDFDRAMQRQLTFWRFANLDALKAYGRLPDLGTGAANHALTASTEGITFQWLTTDQAEEQNLALGKAQAAEKTGSDKANPVWDAEHNVYRVGDNAWMYQD